MELEVLFAEDDLDVRELVTSGITRRGHHITVVQNGIEAQRLLADGPRKFNVIILDNRMPGGPDGLEVMRQLRLDKRFAGTPIILHSREPSEELEAAVRALGGIFVPKRDAFEPLFMLIDKIVSR